jgi:hypothetical protein
MAKNNLDQNMIHNRAQFTRREFLKMSLVASGGAGLYLAGCEHGERIDGELERRLAIVEDWFHATNSGDYARFEQLHTEKVFVYPDFSRVHFTGREQVLNHVCISDSSQVEKIAVFGEDQSVCLLANDNQKDIGMCYIFEFSDNLIKKIYEYWGEYTIPVQEFGGSTSKPEKENFSQEFDLVESLIRKINDHEIGFENEFFPQSVKMYVPNLSDPLISPEEISTEGKTFVNWFPRAKFKIVRLFAQGNLVCAQLVGENVPMNSFCFINVFKDGNITEVYQYYSRAALA